MRNYTGVGRFFDWNNDRLLYQTMQGCVQFDVNLHVPRYGIHTDVENSGLILLLGVGGVREILFAGKPFFQRFPRNGFPANKISLTPPTPSNKIKQEFSTSVCIPYLGKTSHQIERILASSGIKVYHCSNQKIYQLLYTHKDKTDRNLKPGVYRIPCTCGKVYIGETSRNLKVRQKEHKDCCLKCQLDKSALAKHAWENDHPIKWDDSELLVPVRNYFSRQIRESVEIFKNKTIVQEEKPLHDTWTCLFSN